MADIAKLGIVVEASGIEQAKGQLQQLAQTGQLTSQQLVILGDMAGSASRKLEDMPRHAGRISSTMRPAGQALSVVVRQLELFGPAAGVAGNAIQMLLAKSGPVGIALLVLGATISFVMSRFQAARDRLAEQSERDLRKIQQQTEATKLDQQVRREIQQLRSLDPELLRIKQRYDDLADAARKLGAKEGDPELGRIQEAQQLSIKRLMDDRLATRAREQQAIRAQISAVEAEIEAFGRSGEALIALNTQRRISTILTSAQAKEHAADTAALVQKIEAYGRLQIAQQRLQTGQTAVSEFESQFGVKFDITNKLAGQRLAQNFASVFNVMKDDPNAQRQLNLAFNSLVSQALQLGLPDIPELLTKSGMSELDLSRLRGGLGGSLNVALDQSRLAGEQWGETFKAETEKIFNAFGRIGEAVGNFEQQIETSARRAAEALAGVKGQLDQIPDVTYKTIVFQTFGEASPRQPWSQFVPFLKRTLGEITQDQASSIVYSVPDFAGRMNQIRTLRAQIEENMVQAQTHRGTLGSPNAAPFREFHRQAAERLSQELARLQGGLRADVFRAAQSRSGGGAGGVTVHIDLRGANLSRRFLDEEMIPALERGIIRATGHNPGFRVLS